MMRRSSGSARELRLAVASGRIRCIRPGTAQMPPHIRMICRSRGSSRRIDDDEPPAPINDGRLLIMGLLSLHMQSSRSAGGTGWRLLCAARHRCLRLPACLFGAADSLPSPSRPPLPLQSLLMKRPCRPAAASCYAATGCDIKADVAARCTRPPAAAGAGGRFRMLPGGPAGGGAAAMRLLLRRADSARLRLPPARPSWPQPPAPF